MAGTRKTVEVTVLSGRDVVDAMAKAGFVLTAQEKVLFDARVTAGDEPVVAFEALLDERVGPSCRSMRDYPPVAAVCGVASAEPVNATTEVEVEEEVL